MKVESNKLNQLAVKIVKNANKSERDALLRWVKVLLEIKERDISARQKAKEAYKITAKSKIILPAIKLMFSELKSVIWDKRGTTGRLGLIGMTIGLTVFGGQGAGIAAFGTAVGVPIWIVLGGGGVFAGMLVDKLNNENSREDSKKSCHETDPDLVDKKNT